MWAMLQNANTLWVLAGCVLLGISSGTLGCFAFLRGRSLLGDALAHAALPGVCLAYLVTGSKSTGFFLIGAAVAGLIASYFITMISRHSRIKQDSALAIILSVFFGFGIVLLTYIQHTDNANQSGLDKFLFGQAASLVGSDVYTMTIVAAVLISLTVLLFKEFKLLCFDPAFGRGLGFPMGFLDGLLMLMLLFSVVIGLQAVGVVLVAAMLIAPAVTARYWTDKLSYMVVLSGVFGALSGGLGTLFSTQVENLPTGPMIVLAATCFFLISLLFSPRRGVLMKLVRYLQLRKKVLQEDLLQAMYELMEHELKVHPQLPHSWFSVAQLAQKTGKTRSRVEQALTQLNKRGYITGNHQSEWMFTPEGLKHAHQIILNQRLWDLYLMNEHQYQALAIDVNQEEFAAQLDQPRLEQMLKHLEEYNLAPNLPNKLVYHGQWQVIDQGGLST